MDITNCYSYYSCDDEENEYEQHVQSMKSVLLSSLSSSHPTPANESDISISVEPSISPVELDRSSKSAMAHNSCADSATYTLSMCGEDNNFRCYPGVEPPVYSHRKLKYLSSIDSGTHRDAAIIHEPDFSTGYPEDPGCSGSTFTEVILPGFYYLAPQPLAALSSSSTRNTEGLAPKRHNLQASSGVDITRGNVTHRRKSKDSEVGLNQHMHIAT